MEIVMNTFSGSILWFRLGEKINSLATNIFKYQSLTSTHLFILSAKYFVTFSIHAHHSTLLPFAFGFSESLYLLCSNMKRYDSSWLGFSSLLQSELLQEHHRKCKDCKHIDCLATEDRLSPRWSPTASSSRYSARGGKG